jgi:hypothetical protein
MREEITPEEMDYSIEKIREMRKRWGFDGFTADTCGNCKATVNVLNDMPGWSCPCGHYNVQSWSSCRIPHDTPMYGPSRAKILMAYGEEIPGFRL